MMEKYLDRFAWITICITIVYFGGHLILANI